MGHSDRAGTDGSAKEVYPRSMSRFRLAAAPLLLIAYVLTASAVSAQVATLATPGPEDASAPPVEDLDGEEAILRFVGCLRENGIDLPDPQFGPEGVRFADPTALLRIDLRSSQFLDAIEACGDLLAALQPELDPAQQAEQVEQQLELAECYRREGVDVPDPDPVRGWTISLMRGEDGKLAFDPFSPAFLAASEVCLAEVGMEGIPGEVPGT